MDDGGGGDGMYRDEARKRCLPADTQSREMMKDASPCSEMTHIQMRGVLS